MGAPRRRAGRNLRLVLWAVLLQSRSAVLHRGLLLVALLAVRLVLAVPRSLLALRVDQEDHLQVASMVLRTVAPQMVSTLVRMDLSLPTGTRQVPMDLVVCIRTVYA